MKVDVHESLCAIFSSYSKSSEFKCQLCETEVQVSECFRDRAVTLDLNKATIQCTSPGCPWKGKSEEFKVKVASAKRGPGGQG